MYQDTIATQMSKIYLNAYKNTVKVFFKKCELILQKSAVMYKSSVTEQRRTLQEYFDNS